MSYPRRTQAAGIYLKSIRYKSQEQQGVELDLTSGAAADIELLMSSGAGTLEGKLNWPEEIEKRDEVRAVLVPEKDVPGDTRPVSSIPDQNGHFLFHNLAPGTYRAFGVTGFDPDLWENAAFVGQLADQGKEVEIVEKGRAQVDVTVLRASEQRRVAEGIK